MKKGALPKAAGTGEAEVEPPISLKEFLEEVPPGQIKNIKDLGSDRDYVQNTGWKTSFYPPELFLHCDVCDGFRHYSSKTRVDLYESKPLLLFVTYICRNCTEKIKVFALHLEGDDLPKGCAYKYGELPQFGPPTSRRVLFLIEPDTALYLKGRRAENQELGIAAFAYYRRVIEDRKDRIFDEIIKVSRRLSAEQKVIADLENAKKETQFTKAVEAVKHGIPQALLINGHNPLTLLHSALSEGLHAMSDEQCLEIATSIRVVIADFAERMSQVLKDEAEVTTAVSRLLKKKSGSGETAIK
jgi:hypothetical protein